MTHTNTNTNTEQERAEFEAWLGIKPEVVAWRWRKPVVNGQGETIGDSSWELSDAPDFLTWWTNEPLIRLSDYQRLQADHERLQAALAAAHGMVQDAERYRALVESGNFAPSFFDNGMWGLRVSRVPSTKAELDAAVDRVIAANAKQGGV